MRIMDPQERTKKIVGVVLALVIVVILATVAIKKAHAADEVWTHWGAAPFAANQAEACKKAFGAINAFALPLEVRKHFKQVIGDTCKSGTETWLTPHERLEQMWTGGNKAHVMNKVTVAELPVLKSPDGRKYRSGSVAETVKALEWKYEYEGKTYVLYLPFVCFNWSWAYGPALAPVEQCKTVAYTVERGDQVRFAVLAQKYLPASACWQLCDGGSCSAPPSPCDQCNWIGPKSVIPAGYEPLHTGRYVARSAHQTLRFPAEVTANYVALCDERAGLGESDSWIVQPTAWTGTSVVVVPYGGQPWPAWGQVDMAKWKH